MIMKTHPQFNLLAVGFPIKIAIAFVVLIVVLPSIYVHFKREIEEALFAIGKMF